MDLSNLDRPSLTYQEVIDRDPLRPAADMWVGRRPDLGLEGVPCRAYTDPAFHRLELERLWTRAWQFACREEHIPQVGDMIEYDIAGRSVMIVRSAPDEIRAFANACLHRGTKLCKGTRSGADIRCPYHGFTWALDGSLKDVPARWDFPQIEDEAYRLPEIRVARWERFVFVNFDPDAPDLESYLGNLPAELASTELGRQHVTGHYIKILPANWKAAMEAFLEAYHVAETHFHTSAISDEWATQYDLSEDEPHVTRFLQPLATHSPRNPVASEQALLDEMWRVIEAGEAPRLPEGMTARSYLASVRRAELEAWTGRDFSGLADAEAVDSIQYHVFPNLVIFRGYGVPAIYRFRPNGHDPDSCIFDLFVIRPDAAEGPVPDVPDPIDLGTRSFVEASALPSWLGFLYDQDTGNLALQQEGMKSMTRPELTLSRYQEVRIRHFHRVLARYLAG